MGKRLTPEQDAQIEALFQVGFSTAAIAAKVGCSYTAVAKRHEARYAAARAYSEARMKEKR